MLVEKLLQALVGVIDAELLKRVDLEVLKAKDVEHADKQTRGPGRGDDLVERGDNVAEQGAVDGFGKRIA